MRYKTATKIQSFVDPTDLLIKGSARVLHRIPDKSIHCIIFNPTIEWSFAVDDLLRILIPGGSMFVIDSELNDICSAVSSGFKLRQEIAWIKPNAPHRSQKVAKVLRQRSDSEASDWASWRVGKLKPTFTPIHWLYREVKTTLTDNVLRYEVGAFNQDAIKHYFGDSNVFNCGLDDGVIPQKLLKALCELVTLKGQLILDPFANQGSTLIAAKSIGRKICGLESNLEKCRIIKTQLKD